MGLFTHSINKKQMKELKAMSTAIGKILDRGAENYALSANAIEKLSKNIDALRREVVELRKNVKK